MEDRKIGNFLFLAQFSSCPLPALPSSLQKHPEQKKAGEMGGREGEEMGREDLISSLLSSLLGCSLFFLLQIAERPFLLLLRLEMEMRIRALSLRILLLLLHFVWEGNIWNAPPPQRGGTPQSASPPLLKQQFSYACLGPPFPPSRLLSPPPLQLSSFPQTVSPRLFSPPRASTVKRKFTDTCGIGPGRLRLTNFPQPFSPSLF